MSYRIKSVAALTGLTTSTLRAWERRYGLVSPSRTSGGYRVYSDDDVARLTRIKSLLDNGFKVSEAIALVEREAPALPPGNAASESLECLRHELRDALLSMDRPRAVTACGRMASLTFDRRVDEVYLPVLRGIGDLWERGEASVAQEHFASAFVRERLTGMLTELDAGPAEAREVVFAGLPGERHELGLLGVAVLFAVRGWRVTFLGADLPFEEIGSVIGARHPALLCTAMVQRRTPQECGEIVERLRSLSPNGTRIVIGGSGIPTGTNGADGQRIHLIPELRQLLDSPLADPAYH
jgi:MerR family transcriptional regulator, light-induced transcriptional regulator